jgi:anti-anti-sigma regulatory factor
MNSKKFHAKLRASEAYSFLRVRGVIDEDNHLATLVPKLSGDVLVVDAGEVDRINSCGVRDWVNWIKSVEEKGFKVVLIRCSPSIVTQINMVTNFVGNAVVHSFQAPYYCPSCDREYLKLIETETLAAQKPARAPSFRCSECGGVLDFDDIEESYFAFLNSGETGALDHRIKHLVDEVSPDLEAKIRALNEAGSGPLSGPLHTVGTMSTFSQAEQPPDAPAMPPSYLDIDQEEGMTPLAMPAVPESKGGAVAETGEVQGGSTALMYAFVVSAIIVIGLLIYFAVTGV